MSDDISMKALKYDISNAKKSLELVVIWFCIVQEILMRTKIDKICTIQDKFTSKNIRNL